MLKMVVESWKKDGMSRADFIEYLARVHGPLVKKHGPALGFKKYLQNHRLPSAEIDDFAESRGWGDAPDSSVEIWFDDAQSMAKAFASPEAAEASAILEADEVNFVNPANISAFLSEEHVIFDYLPAGARQASDSGLVKMVCQVWKKPGLAQKEFLQRWRNQHGDLVREHAAAMGFERYVQSHPVDSELVDGFSTARGWRQAPDGITEIWWKNTAALTQAFASAEAADASAILAEDEVKFIDPPKITAFLAKEHVVFDLTA